MENKKNGTEEENKSEAVRATELPEAAAAALQMEEMQKQLEQYRDLLLRKAAEFDNYKRRTENDTVNIAKYAKESLVEDLLHVLDDIERSLKHGKESTDYEMLVKGVELIYQKFKKSLEAHDVKAFETVGKEFDVNFHDAVMQIPRSNVPVNTVIDEVEKGYMMGDKIIRHAKVVVSSAPFEEREEAGKSD